MYLQKGDFDKAIADYDAALRLRPKQAWSLYGRGLAKLRQGKSTGGEADVAAAKIRQPQVAELAGELGLHP